MVIGMTHKRSYGFTLLEMAFVIIIIGAITGMGIVSTLGVIDAAKRSATEKKLDTIEDALKAYLVKSNRLPCPTDLTATSSSSTYNVESQTIGSCSGTPAGESIGSWSSRGGVPTKTLGLPDSFMYDGWGRKIVYTVDKNTTYENAFEAIGTDEYCELQIEDTTGALLTGNSSYTGGAAYVLLSYGENGHGAYTQNGIINSSGSTNADELQNCRCNSSGVAVGGLNPRFVQQDQSSTFDDIVRFKEPWQLQIGNKTSVSGYQGADMIMSLSDDVNDDFTSHPFETQCGRWATFTGSGGWGDWDIIAPPYGMEIFDNNRKLFVAFRAAGGSSYCTLDSLTKDTYTSISIAAGLGATCSTYNASPLNSASISKNGYIVITKSAAPYIDMWKINGDYAYQFSGTSPAVILSPSSLLTAMPTKVVISSTGKYIAMTRNVATTYTYIFMRTGDRTYTRLTDPSNKPDPTGAIAFSKDEKLLAMAVNASPNIRVWSINPANGAFTELASSPLTGGVPTTAVMNFSPDGRYLGYAGGGPVNAANYSTQIALYRVNNTSPVTLTQLALSGAFTYGGTAFTDIGFSPNADFMILPFTGSGDNKQGIIFRRTSTTTFAYHSDLLTSLTVGNTTPLEVKFRD